MTPQEVLALTMGPNDADAPTIRDYLKELLASLWKEGEGFNGKRPFGNSCWEFDLYKPLLKAGIIAGKLDGEGFVEELSTEGQRQADVIILEAIRDL